MVDAKFQVDNPYILEVVDYIRVEVERKAREREKEVQKQLEFERAQSAEKQALMTAEYHQMQARLQHESTQNAAALQNATASAQHDLQLMVVTAEWSCAVLH